MATRQEPRTAAASRDALDAAGAPQTEPARSYECDACGKRFEGEPTGRGLYIWTRGDEVRYEEPPLCERCADAVGLAALAQWEVEEEGE
jgi:hypothetical protein